MEGRGCRETWRARRCEKGTARSLAFPATYGTRAGRRDGGQREEAERRQAALRSPRPPASRRLGAERASQTSPGNTRKPRASGAGREKGPFTKKGWSAESNTGR